MIAGAMITEGIVDTIAATRDDIKRWSRRAKAADKRTLAEYTPLLNARRARLLDLDDQYAAAMDRVYARFARDELLSTEAYRRAFPRRG